MIDWLKNAALTLTAGLCIVLFLLLANSCRREAATEAKLQVATKEVQRLSDAVASQKREAAAILRAENAGVIAKQRALDDARTYQEKNDVGNRQVVDGLRDDLRDVRAARRVQRASAAPAGRGGGGGSQPGARVASADSGAGDRAGGTGLFPTAPAGADAGDEDAYLADRINLAYISCRADAFKLRDVLGVASRSDDPIGFLAVAASALASPSAGPP